MQKHPWEKTAELLRKSARQTNERQVGVEIERVALWSDGYALHYWDGKGPDGATRPGAEKLLAALGKKHGWTEVTNSRGEPLGFSSPSGKISLEPGSQLEFSADPTCGLLPQKALFDDFEAEVEAITKPWGVKWLGIGVNPTCAVNELDVIPSDRYAIMTDYLGARGKLGTSMMRLTTSIQINLDYTSESEAIEMLRTALAVAPLSYALFANSPFSNGKLSKFLSFRGAIWEDTDSDRVGLVPEAFRDGFSFRTTRSSFGSAP